MIAIKAAMKIIKKMCRKRLKSESNIKIKEIAIKNNKIL